MVQLLLLVMMSSIASAGFTLQLGSFRIEGNAQESVRKLVELGYDAVIDEIEGPPGKGSWHKVRVGHFATRNKAFSQKAIMQSNGFAGDIIVVETHDVPSQRLPRSIDPFSADPSSPPEDPPPPAPVQTGPDIDPEKPTVADGREVTITWDASEEPDLAGYKIYYDTDPAPPYAPDQADYVYEGPPPIIVGRGVTEFTLHRLTDTKDYFFAITSFNSEGLESDFSAEMSSLRMASQEEGISVDEPDTYAEKSIPPLVPDDSFAAVAEVYPIAPGDILHVDVPGQRDMSHTYDVDPDGNLHLLMIGKVHVGGLNLPALKTKLGKRLNKYIQKGDKVSVELLERRRYVFVAGGIRYQGWYRVSLLTGLDEIIQTAGGLLPGVDYSRIRLKRKTEDGYKETGARGEIAFETDDILSIPIPKGYRERVDNGDLLFINIPQRQAPTRTPTTMDSADLSREMVKNQVEVDKNGYIYIPDYGHFYVSNLRPDEITKMITDSLPGYLARLQKVRVSIIEKQHFVRVFGHVTNPGWYNIPESANVQSALNAAGDAIDGAVMSDVVIHREEKGEAKHIKVNLYQYSVTGDPRLLTPLHESDVIFVPISSSFGSIKRTLRSWEPPTERLEEEEEIKRKVRIFGAVNNPGIYEPYEDMDLLDLLVLASGERLEADLSKIVIIRNNKAEVRFNFIEYLKNVGTRRKGTLKMPKIFNGDTVYVRFVESKVWEPKEDKVFYITGKIKRPNQYKLWDQMTVLQAIALAGGLDEWADTEHIVIVRMVAGKQENIPFNYKKGISGKLPELNIYIQSDDTIVVP